ncbi:hypothetical protein PoB_003740900 [Plakobranchus ocellatus]|uniref:Uncharacterized protein n=1 Tax=Plakobranchus ocellatus TaxID=259542 RepID=A0AAV4AXN6_9GAST|nr:hypothetical protein PoB_003740900 [Plakobranchus ocellatus]
MTTLILPKDKTIQAHARVDYLWQRKHPKGTLSIGKPRWVKDSMIRETDFHKAGYNRTPIPKPKTSRKPWRRNAPGDGDGTSIPQTCLPTREILSAPLQAARSKCYSSQS